MILLLSPVVVKVFVGSLIALVFFAVGAMLIHRIANGIGASGRSSAPSHDALAAYESVIHRLRHQEQQLEIMRRAESDRAQTSESISAAVLANLSSGVLLFNSDGLVQQANDAARDLLDLTAPCGSHARDVFRDVKQVRLENGENAGPAYFLAEAIDSTLHEGTTFRRLEADYHSSTVGDRVLGLTISPVRRQDSIIAAVCLISDITDATRLSSEARDDSRAALSDMCSGMASQFQKSLAVIANYAHKVGMEDDVATLRQHAFRITAETEKLNRAVGDFLELTHAESTTDNDHGSVRAAATETAARPTSSVRTAACGQGDNV